MLVNTQCWRVEPWVSALPKNPPWKVLENIRQQKLSCRDVQSLQREVGGWSRVSYHLLKLSGRCLEDVKRGGASELCPWKGDRKAQPLRDTREAKPTACPTFCSCFPLLQTPGCPSSAGPMPLRLQASPVPGTKRRLRGGMSFCPASLLL